VLALVLSILVGCAPTATPAPTAVKPGATPTAGAATPGATPTAGAATPGAAKRGGTLTVALQQPVLSLDPADYRDRVTETFLRNIFDGLVTRTKDNRVVLEMAESAKMVDAKTWEFKLKKGITFHNGDPCTAEDVKFSFDRIIKDKGIDYPEPHTAARQGLIAPLQSVEVVDPLTVRFNLNAPWPVFMQMLVHQQIVPKKYFEQVGTKGFIQKPIGAGPFKFVEGKLDDQLVLERYDNYYGGANDLPPVGPALLDRVIFKVIPETSSRVAALQAGNVDIAPGIPPDIVSRLKSDPNLQVMTCIGTSPYFVEMNVKDPVFQDVRVRQAMNYGVDVKLLVDKVLGGYAVPLPGPLSPANNYADPNLKGYGFNVEKAKALLKDAGREKFSFVIDTEGADKELAEAVAGQLRTNLGLDVSVRVWDWAVLKPKLLAGERAAVIVSFGDSAFDPVGYFEAKFHSPTTATYGRANYSGYSNSRVDELIKAGEIETDEAKRHQIYNEAQRIVWEEAPEIFLVVPQQIAAASARVQNWSPSPDSRINLHDVWVSR
jgi:peptide/nickel transport system substrate-binding protein